ncbi:MAG: hypothetical protein ABSC06_19155 [Rhodopila sp.]|jgi:hypothetical protein
MVMDTGLDTTRPDSEAWDASGEGAAGQGEGGFSDAGARRPAEPDMPDPRKLAQDWITLWQSELSAMAADPEIRESWQTVMALWAGTMSTLLRGLPREQNTPRHDSARGRPWAPDAPRAPATAVAPDARDAEIERLARHVAALERQLAKLVQLVERGDGGDPPVPPKVRPKPGPGRKPRK